MALLSVLNDVHVLLCCNDDSLASGARLRLTTIDVLIIFRLLVFVQEKKKTLESLNQDFSFQSYR